MKVYAALVAAERREIMKRIICFFLCAFMLTHPIVYAENEAEPIEGVNAKSCILIEQSTGEVLREMNADDELPIASVTKIMTMLLIMEQIDGGILKYDDMVSVSENAMSYGGSTMFLEAGEQLTVNDMLKGIAVASANDGCVAMAEHIAGSESAFVDMMNKKAADLGMEHTSFANTNGLDEDGHYSSARDVAIMSRELLNHPKITDYTSIWTDELRDGKFQLANTNKLIRFYTGANGLKTGSTSEALCCLSASAVRDDMQLIAVVLGAPTSAERFASAKALLDYGFANYHINELVADGEEICPAEIENGTETQVMAIPKDGRSIISKKTDAAEIKRQVYINDDITAPVNEGDVIGTLDFLADGKIIDSVELCADRSVAKKGLMGIMRDLILGFVK